MPYTSATCLPSSTPLSHHPPFLSLLTQPFSTSSFLHNVLPLLYPFTHSSFPALPRLLLHKAFFSHFLLFTPLLHPSPFPPFTFPYFSCPTTPSTSDSLPFSVLFFSFKLLFYLALFLPPTFPSLSSFISSLPSRFTMPKIQSFPSFFFLVFLSFLTPTSLFFSLSPFTFPLPRSTYPSFSDPNTQTLPFHNNSNAT